jgi:hypothetical protein
MIYRAGHIEGRSLCQLTNVPLEFITAKGQITLALGTAGSPSLIHIEHYVYYPLICNRKMI